MASFRLIEVQGHMVLSGKPPHPRLCHVAKESRTPSTRSPHALPFDAHSLPGKGGPTEELNQTLRVSPTPPPHSSPHQIPANRSQQAPGGSG